MPRATRVWWQLPNAGDGVCPAQEGLAARCKKEPQQALRLPLIPRRQRCTCPSSMADAVGSVPACAPNSKTGGLRQGRRGGRGVRRQHGGLNPNVGSHCRSFVRFWADRRVRSGTIPLEAGCWRSWPICSSTWMDRLPCSAIQFVP